VTSDEAKALFDTAATVGHYREAAVEIGLWRSEERVLRETFSPEESLIELGCGAGRIALGLWELGYRRVLGTDFARGMVTAARQLARKLEYEVPFRVADATKLPFEDAIFDGAIFGFNGLMQIPRRERRRTALREMRRVVRPGGRLVFTTHDRDRGKDPARWAAETARWARGEQDPRLEGLGDILVDGAHGPIYIHIPSRGEVMEDLAATGWTPERDEWRPDLATEDDAVQAFSVDCRFWVVRRD